MDLLFQQLLRSYFRCSRMLCCDYRADDLAGFFAAPWAQ